MLFYTFIDSLKKITRPTVAEISLQAIAYNLRGIREKVGKTVKIMGVVKANAYGHGLAEVARSIAGTSADYLGVAFPEEGVTLREQQITAPILVFTLATRSQAHLYPEFNLEATVCSLEDCRLLNALGEKSGKTLSVHLKIETGMNRIGIQVDNLSWFLKSIKKMRRIEIKGVYTHFAQSGIRDKKYTKQQLSNFYGALKIIKNANVSPEYIHCANSGALLDMPETHFDMVRPGITMYGCYPSLESSESIPLLPAMTLKTQVAFVKWIEKGESVSYGRRFFTQRQTKIATLPIGYADGYPRLLTGKASVLIHGKKFPVAGTICMDQLMIDVGRSDVRVGDEAVLIGRQGRNTISAWDMASLIETIPYEIFTGISSRVPRTYV